MTTSISRPTRDPSLAWVDKPTCSTRTELMQSRHAADRSELIAQKEAHEAETLEEDDILDSDRGSIWGNQQPRFAAASASAPADGGGHHTGDRRRHVSTRWLQSVNPCHLS